MRITSSVLFALALVACTRDGGDSGETGEVISNIDSDGDGIFEGEDCDDNDADVYPDAEETCNGVDDNCDGEIDNDATDAVTYTEDADGDGAGGVDGATTAACEAPSGYVTSADDCDDTRDDINPAAEESDCADPVDYNCDGSVGYEDADADGTPACEDCDDTDATAAPGLDEVVYDGVDNDCDVLTLDDDLDEDGFIDADDCDDDAADVNPDAAEVAYDGIDNDCDEETLDDDLDGDGVLGEDDCDDNEAGALPGGTEIPYDGIDNDCDPATLDDDLDGDGSIGADDCDDGDASVNPGATEEPYDGVDNDCNAATLDDDLDEDGSIGADDCDDTDANVNPGATEEPYDGVDNDCNAETLDDDLDGDGKNKADDCDDADPNTYVGADEIWYDGKDQACDGGDDFDQDGDGAATNASGGIDCVDTDSSIQGCGLSADTALESCKAIKAAKSDLQDGTYWIDPTGADAFEVTCDMSTDEGGWTVIEYAADLPVANHGGSVGDRWGYVTDDFTTVLSTERIAAIQSVSTEGKQSYVGQCSHVLHWFYTADSSYGYAAGFKFLDQSVTSHGLQAYSITAGSTDADLSITVDPNTDKCRSNAYKGDKDEYDTTVFEINSVLVPVVNIELRDSGDSAEEYGTELTKYPAYLR